MDDQEVLAEDMTKAAHSLDFAVGSLREAIKTASGQQVVELDEMVADIDRVMRKLHGLREEVSRDG